MFSLLNFTLKTLIIIINWVNLIFFAQIASIVLGFNEINIEFSIENMVTYDYLAMGVFPGGYSLNKGIFRFISTSKEKLSRGPNKKIHLTPLILIKPPPKNKNFNKSKIRDSQVIEHEKILKKLFKFFFNFKLQHFN